MGAPMVLEERELDRFNDDVAEESAPEQPSRGFYSRLSPFHMPSVVRAELNATDDCVIYFIYPNSEPGEEGLRAVSNDGEVKARLGKYTRKVLEVRFPNARQRLCRDASLLDPHFAQGWRADLPQHAWFACERNAVVASHIVTHLQEAICQRLDSRPSRLTPPRQ